MHTIECQDAGEFLSLFPMIREAFRIVRILTPRTHGAWGWIVRVGP